LRLELEATKEIDFEVDDEPDDPTEDAENSLYITNSDIEQFRCYIKMKMTLSGDLFHEHQSFIENMITDCGNNKYLVSAHIEQVREYIITDPQAPGHAAGSHQGLIGATWKTWIGKWAFPFAPPYIVETCKNIYYMKIHENYMYLHFFENANDYKKTESNTGRWDFRKKTGILYCVEKQNFLQKEKEIPQWKEYLSAVEIQINNDNRTVVRYLDENNEVVTPDKAVKKYADTFSIEGDLQTHVELAHVTQPFEFEETLNKMIEKYQEEKDFWGAVSEAEIVATENTLGLKFPSQYRKYIGKFGSGGILGVEITGVEGNKGASVIKATERYRKFGLDKSIVVIMDAGEFYMCMKTSQNDERVYSGDRSGQIIDCYNSFYEFVIDYFKEAIDNEGTDNGAVATADDVPAPIENIVMKSQKSAVSAVEEIFKSAGYTVTVSDAGDGSMITCLLTSPFSMLVAGCGNAAFLEMFVPLYVDSAKNQNFELKTKNDWFYYGSPEAVALFEEAIDNLNV